jgi:hypothetical protein
MLNFVVEHIPGPTIMTFNPCSSEHCRSNATPVATSATGDDHFVFLFQFCSFVFDLIQGNID